MVYRNAALPEAWGVLYAAPNKDGSRKNCWNCMMWVSGENKCVIHAKSVTVKGDMICGYHVPGVPMKVWMDHPGIEPVDPKTSGLETVVGGTSCDTCKYYEAQTEDRGNCWAVSRNGKPPVQVQALGCCARWESVGLKELAETVLKWKKRVVDDGK